MIEGGRRCTQAAACSLQCVEPRTELDEYVMFVDSSRAVGVRESFLIRPRVERDVCAVCETWRVARLCPCYSHNSTPFASSKAKIIGIFNRANFQLLCSFIQTVAHNA